MHFRGACGQRDSGPCELRNYNNNNDLVKRFSPSTEYFDDELWLNKIKFSICIANSQWTTTQTKSYFFTLDI